jgi:hypothetical protein
LELFSARLEKENLEDVVPAIEKIQYREREEGENAIPEMGAILAEVASCARLRRDREANGSKTILARWQCPSCGVSSCGYIAAGDRTQRYCKGIPKGPHAAAEICGGSMERRA